MRDRFITFALHYGKRRTKSQKNKFIKLLLDVTENLRLATVVHQFKMGVQEGRNIIVGDLKSAKVVYMADYDTRERILRRNGKYSLIHGEKNLKMLKTNLLFYFALSVILALAALGILQLSFGLAGVARVLVTIVAAIFGLVSLSAGRGFSSKYNFKKTSSLFLLVELMDKLRGKKRCFVLADHSLFTGQGRGGFFEEYGLAGKKVVLLENAGTPGETACAYSSGCSKASLGALQGNTGFTVLREEPFPFAKEKGFEFFMVSQCKSDEEGDLFLDSFCTKDDIVFEEEAYERIRAAVLELDDSL